jgi:hypothetical protein
MAAEKAPACLRLATSRVRALAERLAELARSDSDPQQQARLATVLNDLLNK